MLLTILLGLSNGLVPNNHSKPPDESLIARIGEGDQEAFSQLYYQTEKALYSFVLSLTKNHHDALDIMQDTYLKIRASAHLYKPMGKPLAWIFTIARNLTMSHFRDSSRFADDENDMEDDLQFSYVTDVTDRLVLETAMKALKEDERQIVLLYAVNGYKHREIADSLDMPLPTVLSKYRRALAKLKKILTEGGEF